MEKMGKREYSKYSKRARRAGDDVYSRESPHSAIMASLYEADAKRKKGRVKGTVLTLLAIAACLAVGAFLVFNGMVDILPK